MTGEQNIPQEASANSRALSRHLRDMFVALMAEGFTERQAMAMTAEVLKAAVVANINRDDS